MTLDIRPVITIEDCRHIEDIQLETWHTPPLDVVPDHMILTFAKNGGVVLLALLDERPVGFVMGFQGQTAAGRRKHCSHQAGVRPGLQSRGIGHRLKLAQREAVLAQGITLMTWTFDPMLSRNAYLNIGKLGAVSNTYYRKLYGDMRGGINQMLDSDRLEVAWHLTAPVVSARLAGEHTPPALQPDRVLNPARDETGPPDSTKSPTEAVHFVQIPADIDALKQADIARARAWQAVIRHALETAFAQNYSITDFIHRTGEPYSYYVLTRPQGG